MANEKAKDNQKAADKSIISVVRKCADFAPEQYTVNVASWNGDGNKEDYLRVAYRVLWFNRYCEENNINGMIDDSDIRIVPEANLVIATASVFMNDKLVGKSTAGATLMQHDEHGEAYTSDKLIQTVATAAKGRALANAGFGAAMSSIEDGESEKSICDSPLPKPDTSGKNPMVPTPESKGSKQTMTAEKAKSPKPATGEKKAAQVPKTLEEAFAVVSHMRNHNGKTFGEINATEPNVIEFLASDKYKGSPLHPEYKEAAKIIIANTK